LLSDAKYSEVGLLKVDIQDFEYGGIVNTSIPSSGAINVGRFIPDHFDVSIDPNNGSGSFENACELGAQPFTYTGQKFAYKAQPKLIINAINASGAITKNYTHTDYRKLTTSETNIDRTFPLLDEDQKGVDLTNNVNVERTTLAGALSISKDPADTDIHGSLTFTFNKDDEFTYTKNVNSKISEFPSKYIITLESVKDSDSVSDTSGNQSSTSLPIAITPTQIRLRYGRLALNDNFGPETSDLPITLLAQYWDGTQFIANTDDECTSVDSGKLKVTGFGSTAVKTKASEALVKGATQFILRAPGAGNRGTAELEYETILMPWLQYDWQGDGSQLDPQANAVFGIYRGNDRVIYWREVFR
jgi:MSHA biogenesis protein MshQ